MTKILLIATGLGILGLFPLIGIPGALLMVVATAITLAVLLAVLVANPVSDSDRQQAAMSAKLKPE